MRGTSYSHGEGQSVTRFRPSFVAPRGGRDGFGSIRTPLSVIRRGADADRHGRPLMLKDKKEPISSAVPRARDRGLRVRLSGHHP